MDFSLAFILALVLPALALVFISWTIEFKYHPVSRLQKSKVQSSGTGNISPNFTYYEKRMNSMVIHPISMSAGFFVLHAYSVVLYRVCCCCSRRAICYFHSVLSLVSLACGVLGYVSVRPFYSKEYLTEVKPLQTFHSVMGIVVIATTFIQSFAGLVVFECVKKAALLPTAMFRFEFAAYHFHIGFSIFLGGVVAVISGLSQLPLFAYPPVAKELMHEPGLTKYREAVDGLVICHLAVALSTACVYYVMTRGDFRLRGRIMMARD
ncbi:plasma membrane ascorbate-dependent reductase CYBRD1 [Anabrus simplex]|uniref:plasma membrane ascorbate-dependent reductase CYBRD1 n=1 Tax=Anabrus simplex TaxID=316456 RepID=UPI0035A29035